MVSSYAAGKAAEQAAKDEEKRLKINAAYKLKKADGTNFTDGVATTDQREIVAPSANEIKQQNINKPAIQNIEAKGGSGQKGSFYDQSTNTYKER